MLRFEVVRIPGTELEETIMTCKFCGSIHSFGEFIPFVCPSCKKPLEDAIRIRTSISRKLYFHHFSIRRKRGETCGSG